MRYAVVALALGFMTGVPVIAPSFLMEEAHAIRLDETFFSRPKLFVLSSVGLPSNSSIGQMNPVTTLISSRVAAGNALGVTDAINQANSQVNTAYSQFGAVATSTILTLVVNDGIKDGLAATSGLGANTVNLAALAAAAGTKRTVNIFAASITQTINTANAQAEQASQALSNLISVLTVSTVNNVINTGASNAGTLVSDLARTAINTSFDTTPALATQMASEILVLVNDADSGSNENKESATETIVNALTVKDPDAAVKATTDAMTTLAQTGNAAAAENVATAGGKALADSGNSEAATTLATNTQTVLATVSDADTTTVVADNTQIVNNEDSATEDTAEPAAVEPPASQVVSCTPPASPVLPSCS